MSSQEDSPVQVRFVKFDKDDPACQDMSSPFSRKTLESVSGIQFGISITTTGQIVNIVRSITLSETKKSLSAVDKRAASPRPRPLGVLVMIKEDEVNEKIGQVLYRPQISKDTMFLSTGTVLDVGEGFWDNGVLIKPSVAAGDRVLFPRTSSNVWKDDESGETYMFIPNGNLIAVLGKAE